jgi:probable phosphoglycerate mutase
VKARLRIIRHGEAVQALDGETDPGLSLLGARQALDLPARMVEHPDRLVCSPVLRARETALPLAGAFGLERQIDAYYAELPWRSGQTSMERVAELGIALSMNWSDFDAQWQDWRARLIERVMDETGDVVVVSHFVAINVLVGVALADDRAVVVRPANASVTEFHITSDGLKLVSLGQTAPDLPDTHLAPVQGVPS